MNLKSMLENAAGKFAGKAAIVMGERRVSFSELEETSNRVASALIKMGVGKGDRVVTIQSSNPEFVTVFFGIAKAGGIAVPLDSRYTAEELESLFNDCRPRVLVAENPALDKAVAALSRFPSIEHVIGMDAPISIYSGAGGKASSSAGSSTTSSAGSSTTTSSACSSTAASSAGSSAGPQPAANMLTMSNNTSRPLNLTFIIFYPPWFLHLCKTKAHQDIVSIVFLLSLL